MMLMNDFKKEYQFLKKNIDKALLSTMAGGWYILGDQVARFEKEFAKYIGVKYCIGVANGLEALQISLMALNIGPGDEVITVANTAVATALAISNVGATPVFADTNEHYLIDIKDLETKITSKTKAIIPVHLFGQMADMKLLKQIAKKHNLKIVEDACQAHGASQNGQSAGSLGDLGCFSFYPTKNLGAYGDGGAITTNSKTLYEKCKMLRNYGQKNRYIHQIKGLNSRLDELQAAILRVKLRCLNFFVSKRIKIANLYKKQLTHLTQVKLPLVLPGNKHAFHLFVIEAEHRDKLARYLLKNNVQVLIHYPISIHQQKCYREYKSIRLAKTEKMAKKILSLPIHPFMEEEQILTICDKIKKFYD